MGQVLTNNTGFIFARETSPGVLPGSPDWKVAEPNSIDSFGANNTLVPREPISKLRQRRKGSVVKTDTDAEFAADQTMDSLHDFIEAFVHATAVNEEMTFRGANGASGGFTIPSATATQAAKFQFVTLGMKSLVHAQGYATTGNNSPGAVFVLTADVTATDVLIPISSIVVETAPTNAEVSIAGIRAEDGDLDFAVSGNIGTMTSGNNAAANPIDFTTLGLTIGQTIHIGGMLAANRFGSTAGGSNDSFGEMRIRTIAAGTLTGDKLASTLSASDGTDDGSAGTDTFVDLLFGRFTRNVQSDDAAFAAISYTIETSLLNLFETDPPTPVVNPDGFEYVTAARANQMVWSMPLNDKSTATFSFIGEDAEDPVDNASRKSGASAARLPLFTGALNTAADFFRLGIADVDDTGLTSDFKDLTITLNNNVSGEFVLGQATAKFINNGNFDVTVEGQALFTNRLVPVRIRANTTVTMAWILRNDDGAVAVDVPSATINSDGKEYPVNESVRINLTLEAFVDPLFLTSIGVSLFPVYPAS